MRVPLMDSRFLCPATRRWHNCIGRCVDTPDPDHTLSDFTATICGDEVTDDIDISGN